MKKKGLGHFLALAAVCGVLLAGCGNSEHVISGEPQEGAAAESASDQGSAPQEAKNTDGAGGYVFVYGDVTISMDEDASPVTEALGEPASYYEAASCAFEGLDKIYTYSGFELQTYPTDGKDFVSLVVLKDDSVATPEGVALGDTKAKVEEKYGTDYQEDGALLTYQKGGMKLCFILDGDQVVSIEYRSGVMEGGNE